MSAASLPRVVIDGRMVGPVPHGFSRYVSSLAAGLRQLAHDKPLAYEPIFLVNSDYAPRAFSGFGTCDVGARFLNPLELFEIPRVLKRLGASIYHSPTFSSVRGCPCPYIVTVHDLNHLRFGGFKEKLYYERLLKPFVKKAAVVATVSEYSRQELARWSGLELEQIKIVYNAIDPVFSEKVSVAAIQTVLSKYSVRKGQYFFCLSNLKPHKNLARLAEAFEAHEGGWDLVINVREGELPHSPNLRLIGAPTDDEVRALIAGSGAVVFPSLYEGFGLPPVEAASLGIPVIVSRIPAHREALADLVQGEALWVDPTDTQAWTTAMDRAARGEVLGASIESRSTLLRRYSVLNLGLQMDGIYRDTLTS